MILTCPECASRYFVDDSKVGAAGRVVRCASCGHRWTAHNEDAFDLFDDPPSALTAPPPAPVVEEPVAAAESEPEPPVSALPGEELPKVFRARADAERRLKAATVTGIIWAGMAAVMVLVLGSAIVFRLDVVKLMPGTAGAFASVGLPVNTVGLVIDRESLKAQPSLEGGHAAVTITGVMRNITDHLVTAPPLRVELRNDKDKRVAGRIAAAADPKIPPGETRHFAITFLDPPRTARDVVIGFATEPGAANLVKTVMKSEHPAPEAPKLDLRGAQDVAVPAEAAGHEAPGHETAAPEAHPPSDSHEPAHHD